ncbi:SOS-induced cell division inhibitor SulA [Apirhabdus apintestini]|nr:SOS-induced cell division inhibitor SulA [Erwinia sp. HR93]MEA1064687.1 SOS-induced cell division inhibitor SulA [Erwinia sp. HR93]WPM85914.1 SOS-induced cell division inhibitor SulA [Enterobacteriaceae bacterium CA-0114]
MMTLFANCDVLSKIGLIFAHAKDTVHSYSNITMEGTMNTLTYRQRMPQSSHRIHGTQSFVCEAQYVQGMISEIVYSAERPQLTQMLLLPLLQQLGLQSRWQLWLTPHQKLNRQWVEEAGLPIDKVMQANHTSSETMVTTMAKALQTGNYSVVVGWLSRELTLAEHHLLASAAETGTGVGLILRPVGHIISSSRPRNDIKIHTSLYH